MGYSWPVKNKKGKFNSVRTGPYGSKLEMAVYKILELRERSGEIKFIESQCSVILGTETVKNIRTGKERTRIIRWKVDFSYVRLSDGKIVYVEAKGIETALYRRQLKLWREGAGPGDLEIYKGSYRYPKLVEIVRMKQV